MAFFIRDTGDNRTPKQHSLDIFKQYILGTFFNTLLGKKGSGKPIIMDQSSFKGMGCGDTRTYHFVPQFFGEGIEGQNASIMGNEKTIEEFITEVKVDQIAQAFKKKGKMTDLRTIINLRAEFKDQLANWFRWKTENDMVAALTGYITDGVTRVTGSAKDTTALVNGAGRCFVSNSSNKLHVEAAADSSNAQIYTKLGASGSSKMTCDVLDELQCAAKTEGKYPMKPIRLADGNEYYMLLLHPKAAIQLRQDTRWEKRALNNYMGGKSIESDPIATGAMGIWERIIVKEANYVIADSYTSGGTKKTFARNLLLGADAAIMAYAQTLDYKEEEFDYKRIFGVAADEIRGIKKLTFDGCDINVAQLVTLI